MRLLFTALACLLSVSLSAQEQVITYPYNPDGDSDSLIAVPDMMDILTLFGNEFIPEPVMVDGVVITEWLESSSNQCCDSLASVIDSMQVVLESIESNSGSGDQMYLECVDMGVSLLCGGLGISPEATLQPDDDGYTYSFAYADYTVDNYFLNPHWRKFQIHGLTLSEGDVIKIRHKYSCWGNPCGVVYNAFSSSINPEIDSDGNVYFYLHIVNNNVDCLGYDEMAITLPFDNSWTVYAQSTSGQYKSDFEIFYSNGTSLINTNIFFTPHIN